MVQDSTPTPSRRPRPPNVDATRFQQGLQRAESSESSSSSSLSSASFKFQRDSDSLSSNHHLIVDTLRLDDDTPDLEDTLQLSDSDSSSSFSPIRATIPGKSTHSLRIEDDPLTDDLSKDLAELEKLRNSVKKNLKLRPIRSRGNLKKVELDLDTDITAALARSPFASSSSIPPVPPLSAVTPTSTISTYFTPIGGETPQTAFFPSPSIRHGEQDDAIRLNKKPSSTFEKQLKPLWQSTSASSTTDEQQPEKETRNIQKTPTSTPVIPLPLSSSNSTSSNSSSASASTTTTPTKKFALSVPPTSAARSPSPSKSSPSDTPSQKPKPSPQPSPSTNSTSIAPGTLYQRLLSTQRPLLIDTRPLAAHQSFHLKHSVNIAIPSLILKRFRKQQGNANSAATNASGLGSLEGVKQFITTDGGRAYWDAMVQSQTQGGEVEPIWDGDIIVYDDEMDEKDRNNVGITSWAIIPVLVPLLRGVGGSVDYLEGGISKAGLHPELETLIVVGGEGDGDDGGDEATGQSYANESFHTAALGPEGFTGRRPSAGFLQTGNSSALGSGFPSSSLHGAPPSRKGSGLFQLDTGIALRSKKLPEIEPGSSTSSVSNPPSPIPVSPLPMMSSTIRGNNSSRSVSSSSKFSHTNGTSGKSQLEDSSPSPPPSSIGFKRPPPPAARRPSVPNLRKLDTESMERINPNQPPKLSVRTTKPMRSATLTIPPSLTIQPPQSPSHLTLRYSTHHAQSPPHSATFGRTPSSPTGPGLQHGGGGEGSTYLTAYYTPPHTPGTPKPPPSPSTARPDLDPPTTDEAFPVFTISTILPGFLFLGPELTTPEHVKELRDLGVRRILNIAAECDDDAGLGLREVFDKYYKIPMRDTVEEENISKGVREVCDILDDARLHSAPTYVHCKAGKSRSVTAVMAYLIHANHWTLSKAYAFVLERRKGISPNIGFVSEL
ncbi:hypothetical protein CVT24_000290, partial [Panaeolus cyanescens]